MLVKMYMSHHHKICVQYMSIHYTHPHPFIPTRVSHINSTLCPAATSQRRTLLSHPPEHRRLVEVGSDPRDHTHPCKVTCKGGLQQLLCLPQNTIMCLSHEGLPLIMCFWGASHAPILWDHDVLCTPAMCLPIHLSCA